MKTLNENLLPLYLNLIENDFSTMSLKNTQDVAKNEDTFMCPFLLVNNGLKFV